MSLCDIKTKHTLTYCIFQLCPILFASQFCPVLFIHINTLMWGSIKRVSCEHCYGDGKVERCLSIFAKTIYKAFTFQPNICPVSASRLRLHFTYKTSKQFSCGFSCRQESSRARVDREEESKHYQMKKGKKDTKGSSIRK